MARLSESTLGGLLDRFRQIAPDTVPIWGKMNLPQMIGHVNGAVRYSMGYGPDIPFKGNWKTKYIYAPLILNGLKQVPRNIKVPRPKGGQTFDPPVADLPTLESTLNELMGKVRDGSFDPPHHPFFGTIGPKGWMKFHGVHIDHHLRQFGV